MVALILRMRSLACMLSITPATTEKKIATKGNAEKPLAVDHMYAE